MRCTVLCLTTLLGAPSAACAQTPATAGPPAAVPSLVVFITVDQLRPDYFSRFEPQLSGGLGRLARGGAFFPNAVHDHAITETAPGHAATMSGRFPRSTGIVQNSAGVSDREAPLIGGGGPGASPLRFRGTVLMDWLRAKTSSSRALSVSRKDRGAILPLGRAKESVFWYAANGSFTTSTYYADTIPTWVQRFNARRLPAAHAGRAWTPLLDPGQYPEPDSVPQENANGRLGPVVFPHVVPADSTVAARILPNYPWMDELTLQFALEGLQAMQLGAGPHTDILAVSLSTTDAVGHGYGPDSRELHDQIVRLDRYLGAFLDSLFMLRDSSRVVIALTSDHGVAPYPDVDSHDPNENATYVTAALDSAAMHEQRAIAAVRDSTAVVWDTPFLLINRAAFAKARVSADSVAQAFAAAQRKIPGVMRVDLVRDLAKADTATDVIARRWLHMLPPDLPVELVVTLQPYNYWAPGIATHGTPHDYDARVPVIFYGDAFKPGKHEEVVRVVDMAPTLAAVLGVTPLERLDGRVLRSVLR